jgi:hypothetical protein
MEQRIPRSNALGRVECETFVEQVDERQERLELVVLHSLLGRRRGDESAFEIPSQEGRDRLRNILREKSSNESDEA